MLRHLHVRNLAVIAEAAVELGPGLNVMTGETGAGKSLVVDSLALLAGARASTDLVRSEADSCTVTGVFEPPGESWREPLEAAGIDSAGSELVIRREIATSGRNRVFLNDQPATLRLLAGVAPLLIRIHGQRDELGLVAPDLQRSWLDSYGGARGRELTGLLKSLYLAWADVAGRLERLRGDDRLRHERTDLLRFQQSEIEAAHVVAGEEDEHRRERDLLRNAESISQALGTGVTSLVDDDDSAEAQLGRARAALRELSNWESEAESWLAELEELAIRTGELGSTLRARLDRVEANASSLDALEDRLATLERLFRKYGASSAEVLAHLETITTELGDLEGDADQHEQLEREAQKALDAYQKAASDLSKARARWAKALAADVQSELADLALEHAVFDIELATRARSGSALRVAGAGVDFGPSGFDQVVFRFAPNPGEELRALARVASGGELARVYLALQVAVHRKVHGEAKTKSQMSSTSSAATLVFDEVDSGIGGQEAAAVGRKLKRLAVGGQILAVTHLPQVASFGDSHFQVKKEVNGGGEGKGRTMTAVVELRSRARVEEVARMLAGEEITEVSLEHAEELIEGAAVAEAS